MHKHCHFSPCVMFYCIILEFIVFVRHLRHPHISFCSSMHHPLHSSTSSTNLTSRSSTPSYRPQLRSRPSFQEFHQSQTRPMRALITSKKWDVVDAPIRSPRMLFRQAPSKNNGSWHQATPCHSPNSARGKTT